MLSEMATVRNVALMTPVNRRRMTYALATMMSSRSMRQAAKPAQVPSTAVSARIGAMTPRRVRKYDVSGARSETSLPNSPSDA